MTKTTSLALALLVTTACMAQEDLDPADPAPGGKADHLGPAVDPQILFETESQKGDFWELSGGDLFTAFNTRSSFISGARTLYQFEYGYLSPGDRSDSDLEWLRSAGSCIQESSRNVGCEAGMLSPYKPHRSLVTADDRILVTTLAWDSYYDFHPRLELVNPDDGTKTVFADFPQLRVSLNPRYARPTDPGGEYHLQKLADGRIVYAVALGRDVPTKTFVMDEDGALLAEADGFGAGHRTNEVLLRVDHSATEQEYFWWQPDTGNQISAGVVPDGSPSYAGPTDWPVQHQPRVTSDGSLVLWAEADTGKRIIRFDPSGILVSDKSYQPVESDPGASYNLLGMFPDGAVLLVRTVLEAEGWVWTLRIEDALGQQTVLYDQPQLLADTGWYLSGNSFRYPYLDGIHDAVFDHSGIAYVPIILATGGNTRTRTYVAAFHQNGDMLWGLEMDDLYGGRCKTHEVLESGRLAVLCGRRVSNRMLLIGE